MAQKAEHPDHAAKRAEIVREVRTFEHAMLCGECETGTLVWDDKRPSRTVGETRHTERTEYPHKCSYCRAGKYVETRYPYYTYEPIVMPVVPAEDRNDPAHVGLEETNDELR